MSLIIPSIILLIFTQSFLRGKRDGLVRDGEVTASWKNKYKLPLEEGPGNWYYKLFRLKYKEKFPLSATALVFLTDKWHRFQFIINTSIVLALVITIEVGSNLIEFIVLRSIISIGFFLGYHKTKF